MRATSVPAGTPTAHGPMLAPSERTVLPAGTTGTSNEPLLNVAQNAGRDNASTVTRAQKPHRITHSFPRVEPFSAAHRIIPTAVFERIAVEKVAAARVA